MLKQNLKLTNHNALSIEPTHYQEALKSKEKEQWMDAMQTEYNSLIENNTWTICELPKDRKPIKSKWIFKKKTQGVPENIKFKARLVAQGFSQRHGIDYDETFSPVANMATLRIIIGLRAIGWTVRQLDVDTAYLNANLDSNIYITQPKGFEVKNPELVCKLNKAIYGLKQAGLAWYQHLSKILYQMKFKKSINRYIHKRSRDYSPP